MKTVGIIAEYNPIHNGHIYHLDKTKEISRADFVVVVMNGNFMQRGQPAIMDKWTRSELAIKNGIDLVLELPFVFGCNSAEYFAKGAINILEGLGCVDFLSFGSEAENMSSLGEVANFLATENLEYKENLAKNLKQGLSFPKAREISISACLGPKMGEILKTPNNILAIEYLKAMKTIKPISIKRIGDYHGCELAGKIASATGIRKEIKYGSMDNILDFLPETCVKALKISAMGQVDEELLYKLVACKILSMDDTCLENIFGVKEGLEHRIKKEARLHTNLESLAKSIKSKRYTLTAIYRILMGTLMGFQKQKLFTHAPYGRVLAFSNKGRELLREIKKKSTIDIITNINKTTMPELMKYDILAMDTYNLLTGRNLYDFSDYVQKPYGSK